MSFKIGFTAETESNEKRNIEKNSLKKELQAQLRAKYNPDGSTLRNSQLIMLDILKNVDRICTKYNIEYWLSSGTLLV